MRQRFWKRTNGNGYGVPSSRMWWLRLLDSSEHSNHSWKSRSDHYNLSALLKFHSQMRRLKRFLVQEVLWDLPLRQKKDEYLRNELNIDIVVAFLRSLTNARVYTSKVNNIFVLFGHGSHADFWNCLWTSLIHRMHFSSRTLQAVLAK